MVLSKKISMEAKKIKVIKDWPKSKSVCNIQVFLGFANFYWQFIQSFSRIAAPLISILKTTVPPKRLISKWLGVDDNEVDKFSVEGSKEIAKKLRNLKSEKLSKFQKLTKLKKILSKSGNSSNFNATKARPKFWTLDAKIAFNCLWLAFIKALIFWYFDPGCHI